ncbi:TPA: hypothetical protein ACH3X1_010815 [Trebouxia sp. C0004]
MVSDFDNVLNTVLVPLSSSDHSKRAAASAAVAMLLTQAPSNSKLSSKVLPAITPLLSSEDCLVQRNACAALIAVAESEAEYLQAGMQQWTKALDTVSAKLASPATETDLRITCAEVMGAVGHANAEAAQAVLNQQGVEALISVLDPELDATLQEAGVDSVCKLAAAPESRQQLVHQGVLPAVAKLLQSNCSEVHVRALLALGMLVGSSQDNQTKLANIDGALSGLLVLRLQQDDEDSKHIADGIVAAMLKNPGCKQQLTAALKAQSRPAAETDMSSHFV